MPPRTRLRTVRNANNYPGTQPPSGNEINAKREAYKKAKEDYENALLKNEGRPSVGQEFGKALGTLFMGGVRGASIIINAGAKIGENTEEDLYRRSPQGRADRAIIAAMSEQKSSNSKTGSGSKRQKRSTPPALIEIAPGKWIQVDKSKIIESTRSRGRR